MKGKYVMTDRGPILFPDSFGHQEFAWASPTSAGKFFVGNLVTVSGKSIGLGLASNKKDERLIEEAFLILIDAVQNSPFNLFNRKGKGLIRGE